MSDAKVPVLIGVGEVRGSGTGTEPRSLVVEAARRALKGLDLPGGVDGISMTNTASWRYDDLAELLAQDLGVRPRHLFNAPVGGHWPTRLLDAAAQRIATGRSVVEIVAGCEAQASTTKAMKSGIDPVRDWGWSAAPGGPPAFDPDQLGSAAMQAAGLIAPSRVYPLYESGLRNRRGLTVEQADRESADLYAAMSTIASGNPVAWLTNPSDADTILAVTDRNRMVCEPYRLSMNAMPFVDQAAALVVTDLDTARSLGVADERIVHIWGGAGAEDDPDILTRPGFDRSRALTAALDATLAASEITTADLDVIDVYSCFPVVPKLVVEHLDLRESSGTGPEAATETAVPSVTGGHSSFGGPLNSYSVHSLAAVYRRLSTGGTDDLALVHANGGYLTYQHCTVLSRNPAPRGFVGEPEPVRIAGTETPVAPTTGTTLTVEAATVEYGRGGTAQQAFLVARAESGTRVAAQTEFGDAASALALSVYPPGGAREVVGRRVRVDVRDSGAVAVTEL
ncbi:acetyl-CoA acetyltransferase [Rhodococcus triatomae]